MYNKMEEYNGYTNKPTWLVSLWLSNDEYNYNYWLEVATNVIESESDKDDKLYELSEILQYAHEENNPLLEASIYSDLLTFALAYVNWREIAEHLIEEAKEGLELA